MRPGDPRRSPRGDQLGSPHPQASLSPLSLSLAGRQGAFQEPPPPLENPRAVSRAAGVCFPPGEGFRAATRCRRNAPAGTGTSRARPRSPPGNAQPPPPDPGEREPRARRRETLASSRLGPLQNYKLNISNKNMRKM